MRFLLFGARSSSVLALTRPQRARAAATTLARGAICLRGRIIKEERSKKWKAWNRTRYKKLATEKFR